MLPLLVRQEKSTQTVRAAADAHRRVLCLRTDTRRGSESVWLRGPVRPVRGHRLPAPDALAPLHLETGRLPR